MTIKIKSIITNKYVKKFILHFGCAILTYSWIHYNKNPCDLSDNFDVQSAINEFKSEECRIKTQQVACGFKSSFHLDSKCPLETVWKGCISQIDIDSKLDDVYKNVTTDQCFRTCSSRDHFKYTAYNSESMICYCLSDILNENMNDCDAIYNNYTVYSIAYPSLSIHSVLEPEFSIGDQLTRKTVQTKIGFFLNLNGKSRELVFQLMNEIYDPSHFYLIHIDKV